MLTYTEYRIAGNFHQEIFLQFSPPVLVNKILYPTIFVLYNDYMAIFIALAKIYVLGDKFQLYGRLQVTMCPIIIKIDARCIAMCLRWLKML